VDCDVWLGICRCSALSQAAYSSVDMCKSHAHEVGSVLAFAQDVEEQ
jgi:hypothetical protein